MDNLSQYLNEFDQKIYLKSLISIAQADAQITENEREFIETQAGLLGIDITPYWNEQKIDISSLDSSSLSHLTKMTIIRDSVVLSYIDRNYSQAEREMVLNIAKNFSINKTEVDKIEEWLKEEGCVISSK